MITIPIFNTNLVALVDEDDGNLIVPKRWHAHPTPRGGIYAATIDKGRTLYMHRYLLKAPRGVEVDHINRNTLDNRRANLRLASRSLNNVNMPHVSKSGFRGVRKWKSRWRVQFGKHNIQFSGFLTPEDAARAFDAAAKMCWGEFAVLNFPDEPTAPDLAVRISREIEATVNRRGIPDPRGAFRGALP